MLKCQQIKNERIFLQWACTEVNMKKYLLGRRKNGPTWKSGDAEGNKRTIEVENMWVNLNDVQMCKIIIMYYRLKR